VPNSIKLEAWSP